MYVSDLIRYDTLVRRFVVFFHSLKKKVVTS